MGSPAFPGVPGTQSKLRSLLEPLSDPAPYTLAMADLAGLTANVSSTVLYTAPAAAKTNLYKVEAYIVSTNTPMGATLPNVSVSFTDADSGVSETVTIIALTVAVGAPGVMSAAGKTASVAPGTAISYSTGGYLAGSGTALAYAVHIRVLAL